jgi:hypothetical protein
MNPASDLVQRFQELVAQVPDLVQPLIVALAGAIPFIEGEGAAVIGIIGGIHPVVAAIAAIVGNFVAVTLVVLIGAALRRSSGAVKPRSARNEKFQRAFRRYGVAGVSLLGPLLLPTHFTAAALAGAGIPKATVLLWQGIAIVLWTTVFTLIVSGVFTFLA